MANAIYVSKSDILDLITEENEAGGFTDYSNYSNLWDEVDSIPAADVQPVVHCKDCKYRKERHYEESGEKPYIKYECKFTKYSMSDDGFCSFGAKMLEKPNLQLLKNAVELIRKAKEIKVDGARMDGDKANNVRNLTDEETEIYESWIDHEAKDTGVNIMDSDT
jgi:hypothetical protein